MKVIDVGQTNIHPHFIGAWTLEPLSLCDEIVQFFEDHKSEQKTGTTSSGINLEAKRSVDIKIEPKDTELKSHKPIREYIDCLNDCYQDYARTWSCLGEFGRLDAGSFNIQCYHKGGHFQKVHAERTSLGTSHRVLAWMTYLNTVEIGGSTFFPHYDIDIKPEKGKTLIWPAEWTHAHCGNVIESGSKYIITGWLHFPSIC